MTKRKNNVFVIIINIIFTIAGIGVLYLSSTFWMGSKEDYTEMVNKSYWSFFVNRLFFNLLIGLVLVAGVGFINWLLQKITKAKEGIGKILMIDFIIFTVCSIIFLFFQLS